MSSLAALGIVVGWPLASSLAMQTVSVVAWRGVQRAAAAVDGSLRRPAQRRAPLARLLGLGGRGSRAGHDLCLAPGPRHTVGGRPLAAGGGGAGRHGLCRRRAGLAHAGWMAHHMLGAGDQRARGRGAGGLDGRAGRVAQRLGCRRLHLPGVRLDVLGFFAWYRGLAAGGIARVGQVQLLQPFLTVVAAALLFGESVEAATFLFAVAVIVVIAGGRRAIVRT